jgi:anionic cell wall polymer biosynthesis LytR-Cps2A-Psr (LCP) family protein
MCAAVKEKNSGIRLHKGRNVIKGVQALAFVRQRYGFPNGLGDLDRVKRQQYFLTAAFRKIVSAGIVLNPFKLQDLLGAISSSLFVDQSLDPLKLGRQLENLTADKITGKTIPTDGFADTDVGSVVVVHPSAVQAFVTAIVKGPGKTSTSHKTTPAKTTKKATSTKTPALDSKCIY